MRLGIFVVISLLNSVPAFSSTPQKGFQAEFEITDSESKEKSAARLEVIENSLLNRDLVVKASEIAKNKTSVREIFMSDDEVSSDDALSGCISSGGELEKVTVPAGTFTACKTTSFGDDKIKTETWSAHVPFGSVKVVRTASSGKTETRELTAFGVR